MAETSPVIRRSTAIIYLSITAIGAATIIAILVTSFLSASQIFSDNLAEMYAYWCEQKGYDTVSRFFASPEIDTVNVTCANATGDKEYVLRGGDPDTIIAESIE